MSNERRKEIWTDLCNRDWGQPQVIAPESIDRLYMKGKSASLWALAVIGDMLPFVAGVKEKKADLLARLVKEAAKERKDRSAATITSDEWDAIKQAVESSTAGTESEVDMEAGDEEDESLSRFQKQVLAAGFSRELLAAILQLPGVEEEADVWRELAKSRIEPEPKKRSIDTPRINESTIGVIAATLGLNASEMEKLRNEASRSEANHSMESLAKWARTLRAPMAFRSKHYFISPRLWKRGEIATNPTWENDCKNAWNSFFRVKDTEVQIKKQLIEVIGLWIPSIPAEDDPGFEHFATTMENCLKKLQSLCGFQVTSVRSAADSAARDAEDWPKWLQEFKTAYKAELEKAATQVKVAKQAVALRPERPPRWKKNQGTSQGRPFSKNGKP